MSYTLCVLRLSELDGKSLAQQIETECDYAI